MMIKHIVMWKLKDQALNKTKNENALEMKNLLERLQSKISEVIKIEVGINHLDNEQAYDVVLYTEFNNKDDLAKYQVNPKHQVVVEFIKKVSYKRVFVDYEM